MNTRGQTNLPANPRQEGTFRAVTLLHQSALPIGLEAVRTFARIAPRGCVLEIHSDGSLDESAWSALRQAALPVHVMCVGPEQRNPVLEERTRSFPLSRQLFQRGGYMTKLAVLATVSAPFFFFDSDIVWLRPFSPSDFPEQNAVFSTETWSWYYGIQRPLRWIQEKIPARINSGFAWLPGAFPFERLEQMLREKLYTPDHRYSTDQEIMAFLYPRAQVFSMAYLDRSRVGKQYYLEKLSAVALHFPGRMWQSHLTAIQRFTPAGERTPIVIPLEIPPVLSPLEILRMHAVLWAESSSWVRVIINQLRKLRNAF